MAAEYYIMPLLTFLVGVISLFTDPKDRKKKWLVRILIVALVCASGAEIYFKNESKRNSDKELLWSKARIQELIGIVQSFRAETNEQFTNIATLLEQYGWLHENLLSANVEDIEQSLLAAQEREIVASTDITTRRQSITVQYFPKDVDGVKVERALEELGFKFEYGPSKVTEVATNAIWFGETASVEDVKLVAFTLISAGVRIKVIRPFRNPRGLRASLIQVGADALYENASPLTVEDIRTATEFIRELDAP